MKKTNKILNIALVLATILVIFLIWLISSTIVNENLILPTPFAVLGKAFSLLGSGEFWLGFAGSLGRSLIAFALSFLLGTSLALVVKFSKISRPIVTLIVSILRALPTIAVVLLLLLWTNSQVASVVVTMLVVLPTIYSSMQVALNQIDDDIIEMLKLNKISKKERLKKYIFPIILPSVLQTIGSGLSLNIKLIVAAEVIAGTARSIGCLMSQSKIYFETANLFALVIIMVIVSVVIEFIFSKLSQKAGKYENK